MSITGKIRTGLSILLGFIVVTFLLGQYLDRSIQSRVDAAVTKNFAASELLAELGVGGQQIRRYEKEFFIYVNDDAGRAKYRKEWQGTYDKLQNNLTAMIANKDKIFSTADISALQSWNVALDFYGTEFTRIMARADAAQIVVAPPVEEPKAGAKPVAVVAPDFANATKLANDMIGPGKDRFRELLDGTEKMRKAKIAESKVSVTDIRTLFTNNTMITLGLFIFGAIVAVYLMISIPNAVKKPINEFVDVADKISKGDTSRAILAEGATEFHGLAKALDRLRIAQGGLLEKLRNRGAAPY